MRISGYSFIKQVGLGKPAWAVCVVIKQSELEFKCVAHTTCGASGYADDFLPLPEWMTKLAESLHLQVLSAVKEWVAVILVFAIPGLYKGLLKQYVLFNFIPKFQFSFE